MSGRFAKASNVKDSIILIACKQFRTKVQFSPTENKIHLQLYLRKHIYFPVLAFCLQIALHGNHWSSAQERNIWFQIFCSWTLACLKRIKGLQEKILQTVVIISKIKLNNILLQILMTKSYIKWNIILGAHRAVSSGSWHMSRLKASQSLRLEKL